MLTVNSIKCIISSRGYQIPACFKEFHGYIIPELSKHYKCSASSIPADIIESLSAKLFRLVQTNYFSREKWASIEAQL